MAGLLSFWTDLSTREKIAVGVLAAGVAGYALYKHSQSSSSSSSTSTPSTGSPVDQYGNPLYPTNLSGVYASQPGGTYTSQPGGTTGSPIMGPVGYAPAPSSVTATPSDTLQSIAAGANISVPQLYALNPWLGNPSGPFGPGQNYNPNDPGNVNGLTIMV